MSLVTGFEDFCDEPDAPYYRSVRRSLTPEQTWAAIHERLQAVLWGLRDQLRIEPIMIYADRLAGWHRALFVRDFLSGGEFRSTDTSFAYIDVNGDARMRRGADPGEIRGLLDDICEAYNAAVRTRLDARDKSSLMDVCNVAAQLYAGILAVHPFEDGNGRTAYIALQVALRSQGARWVHFAGTVRDHDRALGPALAIGRPPDYRPLAELLVDRIVRAAQDTGGTI